MLKNWCFWTVVLEKTLESPLDCKEIQPVHPKGNQSWVFIGKTDAEAETPILWPPDVKNLLIWKDSDAGKDWSQEEKGTTEDEMAGWQHWLNGHEFEQTPGVYWSLWTGRSGVLQSIRSQSQTRLSNWTDWLMFLFISFQCYCPSSLKIDPWMATDRRVQKPKGLKLTLTGRLGQWAGSLQK